MAEWISKQGILFQLRHAGTVSSSQLGRKLGSVIFSFLILGGIAAVLAVGYLFLQYRLPSYAQSLESTIEEGLALEEIEATGFSRVGSQGVFRFVKATGGPRSFFFDSTMELFSGKLGYLDGIKTKWSPKDIRIGALEMNLKAGGGEEMAESLALIEESFQEQGPTRVEVGEATLRWGYSKLNFGQIQKSKLTASLDDEEWKISLEGGTFTQNWLRDIPITTAEVLVTPNGIEIVELNLAVGDGTATFTGKATGTPSNPLVELEGAFSGFPLNSIVELPGVVASEFIEGYISGEVIFSGSTNGTIVSEAKVRLRGDDQIVLREGWQVLKALSVLDKDRSYRRLEFVVGQFDFSTKNNALRINNIELHTLEEGERVVSLLGDLETYLPSQEEAAKAIGIVLTEGFDSTFGLDVTDRSAATALENERISLEGLFSSENSGNEAGVDLQREIEATSPTSADDLDAGRLRTEMRIYRLKGDLVFLLPRTVFAENERLLEAYPNLLRGRRQVPLRVETTFARATSKLHDLLYLQARGEAEKDE